MKTEFKQGDLVTFRPYEKTIAAKVLEIVPCKKVTFVKDDGRVFYRLTGANPKTSLVTITTGKSIVESIYFNGDQPCKQS